MDSSSAGKLRVNPNIPSATQVLLRTIGIFMLTCCNIIVMAFYFNSTRNYNLHGKGINSACQDSSITPLDHWVCTDGRLNKTFIFYTDGSPYFLYRDLLSLPKYDNVSVGRISNNLGLLDSGPAFRTSLIGRLDIDYADELAGFDNVFLQTTKFANHSVGSMFYYHFPVMTNLGRSSFDKILQCPRKYDGIVELCREHFIMQDFDDDLRCGNSIECQFTSQTAATDFTNQRYQEYRQMLKPLYANISSCLEKSLAGVDNLIVYQEKTDDLAHDWSTMHKIVLELHARTKANLEVLLDYLLKLRPETLIMVYSDHGHTIVPWEGEYTNHGSNDGQNKGFVMLFNRIFSQKPILKAAEVLATDLFSGWQQLISGANIPKWKKEMPGVIYADDPLEELKILRSRHLQLQSVLGRQLTATDLWNQKLDTQFLGPQILERMGSQKLKDLNKEYRAFLESLEPQFEKHLQGLIDPYKKLIDLLAVLILVADVLVIYYRVKQEPAHESRYWTVLGVGLLVVFHVCLALTVPIKSGSYPLFVGGFLLLAGALWSCYHRCTSDSYKTSISELHQRTRELKIARSRSKTTEQAIMRPKLRRIEQIKLLILGPMLLILLRTLNWYFIKNGTLRIIKVEHVAHFLSKQIAVLGVLTVSCAVLYLLWLALAEGKADTSTIADSKELAIDDLDKSREIKPLFCKVPNDDQTTELVSLNKLVTAQSKTQQEEEIPNPHDGFRIPICAPLRSNLNNMILMINIALVLTMLLALGLYDYCIFRNGKLNQTSKMRTLVQVVYCLFALLLLGTGCVPTHSGRYVLVAAAFVFCAFWATHMNRILYSVLVLPVLIYIMRLAQQQKFIGWLSACMLILQFGLFTANNEEYLFAVSQRCLKRLPIEHPDQNILMTAVNAYCIKFATVILLNMFILTMETTAAFKHSSTILLAHLGMYLVSGKAITSHDEERHSFIIIVGANMLTPAFRLLLGKIHGQIRSLCGLSSKTS